MKKNNLIVIILFSVLGVALLIYFILTKEDEKRYSWQESYKSISDQPYGTKFIKELLENYRPGEKFVYNDKVPLQKLLDSTSAQIPTDYVFIGPTLFLDHEDINALLNFIARGNDAFIASINLPLIVVDSIFVNECNQQIFLKNQELSKVTLNFYHDTLRTDKGYLYSYSQGSLPKPYFWNSLNPEIFCDSTKSVVPLGYMDPDQVNFLKLPYGNGNLYLHSNPLVFSNYFLTKPDKISYAEGVFSHLRGKTIIWDEFSKSEFSGNNAPETNPLSYIMQHASLKYAWWMILIATILYTLFTAKRKQRAIPVLEEKVNTSLEFVKMVSTLHFENANHVDIARKKMKYFLYFVRSKYNIHTQTFTEAHINRLAEKSKVDIMEIRSIFSEFNQIEQFGNNSIAENRLVTLYNSIDNFYKNCK